ncbi:hypothetical protein ACO0QE_000056 [Hanseniaspora vineae]
MGLCSSKEATVKSTAQDTVTYQRPLANNAPQQNEVGLEKTGTVPVQPNTTQQNQERLSNGKETQSAVGGEKLRKNGPNATVLSSQSSSTQPLTKTPTEPLLQDSAGPPQPQRKQTRQQIKTQPQQPKEPPLKMLLLGAGESGKSTILKQLKILHQGGFSERELLNYRTSILENLVEISQDLIKARTIFDVQLDPVESEEYGFTADDLHFLSQITLRGQSGDSSAAESGDSGLMSGLPATKDNTVSSNGDGIASSETNVSLPPKFFSTLSKLWDLPSTQNLLQSSKRSKFYLMDNAHHFIESLPRISAKDYIPSVEDVLKCRVKTSGLHDTLVNLDKDLTLHIYDVGGQRSERKKWIHCFNNVSIILFCISLNEYDQFLLEDTSQNRLLESLALFDSVMNSRWFAKSSVVLFLNKVDLFAEKIKKVPLEDYFPDYTGGRDVNKAAKYILWRFVQLNKGNLSLYPHVTQATDTTNVELVFAAIKETIMENNLKESGVI